MDYVLWREITITVGALLGLLGFFRSIEQRKEQNFFELIRELSNPNSAMLRAAAASQLPYYFTYRSYGLFKHPFQHQALVMALHGLKEKDELQFVRQELINSAHKMLLTRKENNFPRADLIGSNLSQLIMHYFNLDKVDLTDAKINQSDLGSASLVGTKLWKASFKNSNLSNANLNDAMIWDADFSYANLTNVSLLTPHVNEHAKFDNAMFKNTLISEEIAKECKLGSIKGVIMVPLKQ